MTDTSTVPLLPMDLEHRYPATNTRIKRGILTALMGGAAMGVGAGTGAVLARVVLPPLLPKLSPSALNLMGSAVGGLSALGMYAAKMKQQDLINEAAKIAPAQPGVKLEVPSSDGQSTQV